MIPVLFMQDPQNPDELVQRIFARKRCLFLPRFPSYVSHVGIRYLRSGKLSEQGFSYILSPFIPSLFPVCVQKFSICAPNYFQSAFHQLFVRTWSSLWVQRVMHIQTMPPGLGSARGIPRVYGDDIGTSRIVQLARGL